MELSNFINQDSWTFFSLHQINTQLLQLDVDDWQGNIHYMEACTKVEQLKVVNDSAERGVRLASDFHNAAQIEEKYQDVLQVAENDCLLLPIQRRSHLTVYARHTRTPRA